MFESTFPAFILVFREVIEAALVIGIVMAATRGVPYRGRWVLGGVVAGLLGAGLTALFTEGIAESLEGRGLDIFNACILFFAVGMLAWHNIWMASHGKDMVKEMRSVGHDIKTGTRSLFALATVVGLAVLREGAEVVLFLYGIMASGKFTPNDILIGSSGGVLAGGALGIATYFGLVFVPMRHIFKVTGVMITLLAAGMASHGVAFLAQSGIITKLDSIAWDTSWILQDNSFVGQLLGVLIGYTAQPTSLQVLAYFSTIGIITIATYTMAGEKQNSFKSSDNTLIDDKR